MAHENLIREGGKALRKNIAPGEIKNYFLKKGMDEKEAKQAIEQIQAAQILENAKKSEKEKTLSRETEPKATTPDTNEKKSSIWIYILAILLVGIALYLYFSGVLMTK